MIAFGRAPAPRRVSPHLRVRLRQFLLSLVPLPMREAGRMLLRREPRFRSVLIGTYLRRIAGLHRADRLPPDIGPDARVLFVCHGNIFRSPMAEALFAREVRAARGSAFRTSSGGLHTDPGKPAPTEARAAAAISGIALEAHRTTLVTHELIAAAEVVVVMDHENEADMLARFPEARSRLVMLGAFDPLVGADGLAVSDPYGKGVDQVKACYVRVERCVVGLHQALTRNAYTRVPQSVGVLRAAAQTALTSPVVRPLWRPFTRGVSTIFMRSSRAGCGCRSP